MSNEYDHPGELAADRSEDPTFIHSRIDDLGLSLAEFRIYCHLKRRANQNGIAWPGIDSIARICQTSRSTVIRALHGLEQRRIIAVNRTSGERNHYLLTKPSKWLDQCQYDTSVSVEPVSNEERKGIHTNISVPSALSATDIVSDVPRSTNGTSAITETRTRARGSLEELKKYAAKIGLLESDGEYIYNHWLSTGWKRGNQPIRDWRAGMNAWKAQSYFPSQKNGRKTITPEERERQSQRRAMLGI